MLKLRSSVLSRLSRILRHFKIMSSELLLSFIFSGNIFLAFLVILRNKIYPRILLLGCFLFVMVIFYLRLIERLPNAIFPMTNLQWYICLELLIINIIVLLILIKNKLRLRLKPKGILASWVIKLNKIKSHLMLEISSEYVKNILYKNYHIGYFMQYLLYLNYKYFSELHGGTQTLYYYVFLIIPKIIVCAAFSYDVLFANYFLYFYKTVWLLILPLLFRFFVYSLKVIHSTEFRSIGTVFRIDIVEEEDYDGREDFKAQIYGDQEKDENQGILLHFYNHLKNVMQCFFSYPRQDYYTAFRQYQIYKRIWFTIMEIKSFQATKRTTELNIRVIYIVNFFYILIKTYYERSTY